MKIQNNLYVLKLVYKATKSRIPLEIINILFQSGLNIVSIYFIRYILNLVVYQELSNHFFLIVFSYFVFIVLEVLFSTFYDNYYLSVNNLKIQKYMKDLIYNKVHQIDLIEYDDPEFYQMFTKALNECDVRASRVLSTLTSIGINLLSILGLIVILFSLDYFIIFIILINVLASLVLTKKINKIRYEYNMDIVEEHRVLNYIKRFFYLKQYIEEAKIFSFYNYMYMLLNQTYFGLIEKTKRNEKKIACYTLIGSGIANVSNITIAIVLLYKVFNNIINIGDFTALYSSSQQIASSLESLFSSIPEMINNSDYIQNLIDFLNYKEAKVNANIENINIEAISCKNLCFTYPGMSKCVIDNINYEFKKGVSYALVGLNGSGKTTFLRLIMNLLDPMTGAIYYNNIEHSRISRKAIYDNIVYIPQNFCIYSVSIADNILMRKCESKEDESTVLNALHYSGLYEKISQLKDGINTILTKEFATEGVVLSVGQQQKLAISRIYAAKNRPLLVLDEVTSYLDIEAETQFNNCILERNKANLITILVTHKLAITKKVDNIIVMEAGKIVESGSFKDLSSSRKFGELYKKQYNLYN